MSSKKKKGYVSVYRSLQDHWLWEQKPFSRGQAWIDLLMLVNHKDSKVLFNGNLVEVKRGSRITSIRKLCKRWGWGNRKVTRFLDLLQDEGMLTRNSDSQKTVITIENYSLYQDIEKPNAPPMHRQRTTDALQTHNACTQTIMRNNETIMKNNDKQVAHSDFDKFWDEYPKKIAKQKALKKWQVIDPDVELFEKIMEALKKYKKTKQWTENNGKFIPYPTTWLNQARWEDEIEVASTDNSVDKNYSTGEDILSIARRMKRERGAM